MSIFLRKSRMEGLLAVLTAAATSAATRGDLLYQQGSPRYFFSMTIDGFLLGRRYGIKGRVRDPPPHSCQKRRASV